MEEREAQAASFLPSCVSLIDVICCCMFACNWLEPPSTPSPRGQDVTKVDHVPGVCQTVPEAMAEMIDRAASASPDRKSEMATSGLTMGPKARHDSVQYLFLLPFLPLQGTKIITAPEPSHADMLHGL